MRCSKAAWILWLVFHSSGALAAQPPSALAVAAPAPAARSAHAMTYDDTNKAVLLFGGAGAALYRDLWSWDGHAWRRLSNAGPAPRDDAILAHDAVRGRTVLFGGRGGSALLGDTWEWDGALWSRRNVPGPGARLHAVGTFDPAAGCLRIHGGLSADERVLTDTWEWDGSSWTRVAERGAVPERIPNRMVYDASRRRTLMLLCDPNSRRPGDTLASELWEWSEEGWRKLSAVGPDLSPIQDMTTLGAAGGSMLLDGGALQGLASTWIFGKGAWTRAASGAPTPRNGHALAFDPERARVVLFGGFRDGQDFADTWEWDGRDWTCRSAPERAGRAGPGSGTLGRLPVGHGVPPARTQR